MRYAGTVWGCGPGQTRQSGKESEDTSRRKADGERLHYGTMYGTP